MMPIFGFKNKPIPGVELAGEIEEIGSKVTKFKIGDQIFGTTTGLKYGGNAEYICLPETWGKGVLELKPSNLSFEESAVIPVGAMTALYNLRKLKLHANESILIYGASGSVGAYAVQLAKHFGAKVTAVCSTRNINLVKSLGADEVIDYTTDDFTKKGPIYDVVFDAVGKAKGKQRKKVLKKNGRVRTIKSPTSEKELLVLKNLCEEGYLKAIIDKTYVLSEIVNAHKHVETGHKTGNIVIKII